MEFFSSSGITSTEAKHLCNVAAEQIKNYRSELNNLTFLGENVEVLSDGTSTSKYVSKLGSTKINSISSILTSEAEITVLIAYLKEAIKMKDALLQNVENADLDSWMLEQGYTPLKEPTQKLLDYERVAQERLPSDIRIKYLTLESSAAVLGKAIHKDGVVSHAVDELNTYKEIELKETQGNHLIKISKFPSTEPESIRKMFQDLQSQYRTYNSELNRIKSSIKTEATKLALVDSAEYRKQYDQYMAAREKYQAEFRDWTLTQCAEIAKLMITIPEQLTPIYKYICKCA